MYFRFAVLRQGKYFSVIDCCKIAVAGVPCIPGFAKLLWLQSRVLVLPVCCFATSQLFVIGFCKMAVTWVPCISGFAKLLWLQSRLLPFFFALRHVKYLTVIGFCKMAVAAVRCIKVVVAAVLCTSVWLFGDKSNVLARLIFAKWLWL